MEVNKIKRLKLEGSDYGTSLSVYRDTRGEPYREGLTFDLIDGDGDLVAVLLQPWELRQLYKAIGEALEVGQNANN
jgi:hypothetical protein